MLVRLLDACHGLRCLWCCTASAAGTCCIMPMGPAAGQGGWPASRCSRQGREGTGSLNPRRLGVLTAAVGVVVRLLSHQGLEAGSVRGWHLLGKAPRSSACQLYHVCTNSSSCLYVREVCTLQVPAARRQTNRVCDGLGGGVARCNQTCGSLVITQCTPLRYSHACMPACPLNCKHLLPSPPIPTGQDVVVQFVSTTR